jgi:hypothetical protein
MGNNLKVFIVATFLIFNLRTVILVTMTKILKLTWNLTRGHIPVVAVCSTTFSLKIQHFEKRLYLYVANGYHSSPLLIL